MAHLREREGEGGPLPAFGDLARQAAAQGDAGQKNAASIVAKRVKCYRPSHGPASGSRALRRENAFGAGDQHERQHPRRLGAEDGR